jgi:hypothetical protein
MGELYHILPAKPNERDGSEAGQKELLQEDSGSICIA